MNLPADSPGLAFRLVLEHPQAGAILPAGAPFKGFGWALAPSAITGITVWLDDLKLATATIGLLRGDVAEVFPHYASALTAGFAFTARLPSLPPGLRDLRLVIEAPDGPFVHLCRIQVSEAAADDVTGGPLMVSIDAARLDIGGALEAQGVISGAQAPLLVAVWQGDRLLGFGDLRSGAPETSAKPSPDTGFRFRMAVNPVTALEPITVVAHGRNGETGRASRPVTLPAAPPKTIATVAVMAANIDAAHINERAVLHVSGWAVCLAPIVNIAVFVDDDLLGSAQFPSLRDDVGRDYTEYPAAAESGFRLQRVLTDDQLGIESVRVVITATGGISREFAVPITRVDRIVRVPVKSEVDYFVDLVSLDDIGALALSGWAVCPSGVAAIAVELAGVALGEADLGHKRADVGNLFPDNPLASQSGFRFATAGAPACQGEQVIRLTVRGHGGEERVVHQPVLVVAGARRGAAGLSAPVGAGDGGPVVGLQPAPVIRLSDQIKFYLDEPAVIDGYAADPVRGFLALKGWAFARDGAVAIEVFVDGVSQGEAYRGIRREDLHAAFPDWDAGSSGFAMLIPPQVMKRGRHSVRLVVRDTHGHQTEASFELDAEPAAEGPGPWQIRQKIPQAESDLQLAILAAASVRPIWRLVLPLSAEAGSVDLPAARATIASLRHQSYPDWSLTVAIPPEAGLQLLAHALLAGLDDLAARITLIAANPDQPIVELAPEAALFALLAPGDLLGEDALMELTLETALRPDSEFIYSDERRIDPVDGEMRAFFKPDWSPDLLVSTNYIGRLWAARADLLRRSDLSFGDLDRFGEYDAVLRLCEEARLVGHVAKVLCTRGQAEIDPLVKQRFALHRAARRHNIQAHILPGCLPGTWRFKRQITTRGLVSVIIPSIASRGLIETAIRSIRTRTAWPNVEIIVIDNIHGTDDREKLTWKRWMVQHADRVLEVSEDFNWSRFNNLAAAEARGDFLLFLNDDIEVLDEHWLHGLIEHAQRPEIGVVGPQLLYPDGRVQHAGMFLARATGRHAFRFYPSDAPGPFGLALTPRNVISVTGACMLVRRDVFDEVGGFNEAHPIINNDLDFNLRVQETGRLVVYTPHVTLTHHEMVSRAALPDAYDAPAFDNDWKDLFLRGDPYFHPALSFEFEDFLPEAEPLRVFQVGHPLIAKDRVRRILVVKVDHIGDFIAAFPACRRLKQHFPHAELCVLAARASLALAALEPAIDRVIEFNFFHARSELGRLEDREAGFAALQRTLEPERFDIAVDLRRQADTRRILPFTGARWLAGFDQDHTMPWLDIAIPFEGDVARTFKHSHVSESLLHLVDAVGTACDPDREMARPPLAWAAARAAASALPAVAPIADRLFARRVVCLHTGAGAANKLWPAASFAGLIDLLVGQEELNAVIIGGPDEAAFVAAMMADIRRPEHVFSLIGAVGLADLPTLMLAADLYVGNDSGPKHMAAAIGVPTIGIHSGSVDAGEWGPLGPATVTIRRDMTCGPCYIAVAADCPRAMACLHGIKVGDVYTACQKLLTLKSTAVDNAAQRN